MAIEVCPNCKNKVSSNWTLCPYCHMTLHPEKAVINTTEIKENNNNKELNRAVDGYMGIIIGTICLIVSPMLYLFLLFPIDKSAKEVVFPIIVVIATTLVIVSAIYLVYSIWKYYNAKKKLDV